MRSSFIRLFSLLTPTERRSFAALVVIMSVEAMLEMASIGIVPLYITAIAYPEKIIGHPWVAAHLSASWQAWLTREHLLTWGGALLLLFFATKMTYAITAVYCKARFAQTRARKLSLRLFGAYLAAPHVYHLRHNSAELLRNVSQDCIELAARLLVPMVEFLSAGFIVGGISLVLVTFMQWSVLAWLGGFLAFGAASAIALQKRVKRLGAAAQDERGAVLRTVSEGLGGVKEIRLLGRDGYFVQRLSTRLARLFSSLRTVQLIQLTIPHLLETTGIVGLVGVTLMLHARGSDTHEIVATLSVFAVALTRLKGALRGMMDAYTEVRHNAASLDAVHAALQELEADSVRPPHAASALPFEHVITLEHLGYTYPGAGAPSLAGIDLQIRRGEAVAFVGTTGAGKSTLLDLLLGVLEPDQGRIRVDGQDIRDALAGWQRHIGYVPQTFFLLDGSVAENIALGIDAAETDTARIAEAVEAAALAPLIARLPQGLATPVGERGNRLSGGERQRIAIARALYRRPDVLIMDEATSALDNTTEAAIVDAVAELKGDRTVLLVAHRLSTVRRCDRIVFLRHGSIDAIGSYDELLRTHPEFRRMAEA